MTDNQHIEKFIGIPVPFYSPTDEDTLHINIYNFFKPTILAFYEFVNTQNEHAIKFIMKSFLSDIGNSTLLRQAERAGLIPSFVVSFRSYTLNDIRTNSELTLQWVNKWYNELFAGVPADSRLSLVVQGGEAINYYSFFKYDLVPTHDCDTRILAGNHFNYLQKIETLPNNIKKLMHRYRFFTGFGLVVTLYNFLEHTIANSNNNLAYINHFFDSVNQVRNLRFGIVSGGDQDYTNMILNGTYNINHDINIDMLMAIEATVGDNKFGIVDLYCPRKSSRNDLGHSNNLHSYFSTDQVESMEYEAGIIPYLDHEMNYGQNVRTFAGKPNYILRIVPLGYLIWDTLRMLMYSEILQYQRRHSKFMKYKQKLNCLLATIANTNISKCVLNITDTKRAFDPNNGTFMAGGRLAVEKIDNTVTTSTYHTIKMPTIKTQTTPTIKTQTTPTIKTQTTPTIKTQTIKMPSTPIMNEDTQEALAFSKKLFDMGDKEILLETIKTPAEFAGYMNYLSHIEGGWSDFRIPNPNVKPVQMNPPTKEQSDNFMNMLLEPKTSSDKRKGRKTRKTGRK